MANQAMPPKLDERDINGWIDGSDGYNAVLRQSIETGLKEFDVSNLSKEISDAVRQMVINSAPREAYKTIGNISALPELSAEQIGEEAHLHLATRTGMITAVLGDISVRKNPKAVQDALVELKNDLDAHKGTSAWLEKRGVVLGEEAKSQEYYNNSFEKYKAEASKNTEILPAEAEMIALSSVAWELSLDMRDGKKTLQNAQKIMGALDSKVPSDKINEVLAQEIQATKERYAYRQDTVPRSFTESIQDEMKKDGVTNANGIPRLILDDVEKTWPGGEKYNLRLNDTEQKEFLTAAKDRGITNIQFANIESASGKTYQVIVGKDFNEAATKEHLNQLETRRGTSTGHSAYTVAYPQAGSPPPENYHVPGYLQTRAAQRLVASYNAETDRTAADRNPVIQPVSNKSVQPHSQQTYPEAPSAPQIASYPKAPVTVSQDVPQKQTSGLERALERIRDYAEHWLGSTESTRTGSAELSSSAIAVPSHMTISHLKERIDEITRPLAPPGRSALQAEQAAVVAEQRKAWKGMIQQQKLREDVGVATAAISGLQPRSVEEISIASGGTKLPASKSARGA